MTRKRFKGKIVSNKMEKTVVVAVAQHKVHPIYKKAVKSTKRLMARTLEKFEIGDVVLIEETRPLSKNVTWRVISKVEGKAK